MSPWLVLAGLGAFHGLNPAMGWLFAVALGLHRNSRRIVVLSLIPIALGHTISIAFVAIAVVLLQLWSDQRVLEIALVIAQDWPPSRGRMAIATASGSA